MKSDRTFLLRSLVGVHLVAFLSAWPQLRGLVGSQGIWPISETLAAPSSRPLSHPTLMWFASSDTLLWLHGLLGVLVAIWALWRRPTVPSLAVLWLLYLSMATAGAPFFGFQWDGLLLEATLAAMFLAPLTGRRLNPEPAVGLWLLRALAFKVLALSGLTKLLSLDPSWLRLTALESHFETQPLPNVGGWWLAQLPDSLLAAATAAVLVVETIGVALLLPRRTRRLALGSQLLFQLTIGLSGNYGFFNLLTAILCLAWLDDADIDRLRRLGRHGAGRLRGVRRLVTRASESKRKRGGTLSAKQKNRRTPPTGGRRSGLRGTRARWILATPILLLSALVSAREWVRTVPPQEAPPWLDATTRGLARLVSPSLPALRTLGPFRSVNGYGLFRVMTTQRIELIVEESDDGENWREVGFLFKPVSPERWPRFAALHMPRLDWQMWFAAFSPRNTPWLEPLLFRLFQGSAPVYALLADPAPTGGSPQWLRVVAYDYRFTDVARRAESGSPWKRELLGIVVDPIHRNGVAP